MYDDYSDLILENEKLIYYIINKLGLLEYKDDLYDVGMIGLVKAAKTFDSKRNVAFASYACNCIRNQIFYELRSINKCPNNNISISTVVTEDNHICLEDMIPDDINIEEEIETKEKYDKLYKAIDKLNDKEKFVIYHTFSLKNCDYLSQKEIATIFNNGQCYISRIKNKALKKLKKIMKEYKE